MPTVALIGQGRAEGEIKPSMMPAMTSRMAQPIMMSIASRPAWAMASRRRMSPGAIMECPNRKPAPPATQMTDSSTGP